MMCMRMLSLVTMSLAMSSSQPRGNGAHGLKSSKNRPPMLNDASMVLVRLHPGATRAVVTRTFTYAQQLANHPTIMLAVSYDATTGDLSRLDELRGLLRQGGIESTVVIHTFTVTNVLRRYPKLMEAKAGVYAPNRHKPLLWGFHVEPVLMFWESLKNKRLKSLRWLWILEADVVWAGPIDQLVIA